MNKKLILPIVFGVLMAIGTGFLIVPNTLLTYIGIALISLVLGFITAFIISYLITKIIDYKK